MRGAGGGGTDQSGVLVRVTLVHGDGLAADDEETEMAVLVADGVDAEVVHPTGVLRHAPPAPARAAPAPELRRPHIPELHLGHISRRGRHRRCGQLTRRGHLPPLRAWIGFRWEGQRVGVEAERRRLVDNDEKFAVAVAGIIWGVFNSSFRHPGGAGSEVTAPITAGEGSCARKK